MNIITNADVDKFLKLLKAGLSKGEQKELKMHTSAINYDGTKVAKKYFVNLDFHFFVSRESIDEIFIDDDFDVSSRIDDLLK